MGRKQGALLAAVIAGAAVSSSGGDIVFVAHRGGIVPGYPENTLAALRHAMELGAPVLEIDLRGSKDGHVVIIHDRTLDRTTNGSGRVSHHTLAELKRLDAGRGETIPTYEEVLTLISGTGVKLLLDIKRDRALDRQKVVTLTERHGAVATVIAGVRSPRDLRTFRSLNPRIRTLGLIGRPNRVDAFVATGADIIRLKPAWIRADPELITRIHRLGRPVWITAGAAPREELEALMALGVNGIIADQPALIHELMVQRRR